ncbi:MAG: hypothetical protein IIY76_06430 [Erysipelotrichaceae bacterium]|jgi:hypothetical protein|nr:hypothetical protein [Erysipelotrichaceae bacterium]MBQ2078737.1 hypothetical protein [Erysipelotrichaceae bacterium]MBQ3994438.1 hypothetical protein [Erysipelotrichaceae bacterium]
MKKLFRVIVYLATFAAPAMIVEYYDANINPMSPSDKRLAIIGGTIGILIMAVLTGFGRIGSVRTPSVPKTKRKKDLTRIIKDPATGAETIFHWNEKDNIWESDYGTFLDESRMKEWERQRKSDRKWADEQMKKLRDRDTAVDRELKEINDREKRELEQMDKENAARDMFAKKHGIYETNEKQRRKWLSGENAVRDAERKEWMETASENDRVENNLEWIQWGADLGADLVDIASLGTLKPVKHIYIASRNMSGELMDGLLKRKGLGTIVSKGLMKTWIDIKQDTVEGIGYKYLYNGLGDGFKGAMDAEEGKRTEAFLKEGLKGTLRTGIEHGLSKTKLPKTKQANKIMKDTASKSNKVLGMQQAGELTQKTANGIRNIIRTNGAQKMAAEAGKTKDLLNLGLGKLSDGTVNAIYGD